MTGGVLGRGGGVGRDRPTMAGDRPPVFFLFLGWGRGQIARRAGTNDKVRAQRRGSAVAGRTAETLGGGQVLTLKILGGGWTGDRCLRSFVMDWRRQWSAATGAAVDGGLKNGDCWAGSGTVAETVVGLLELPLLPLGGGATGIDVWNGGEGRGDPLKPGRGWSGGPPKHAPHCLLPVNAWEPGLQLTLFEGTGTATDTVWGGGWHSH